MQSNRFATLPARRLATSDRPSVGFVATKPLQIMNSINVWRQLGSPGASLCIAPLFAESAAVAKRLYAENPGFASISMVRSRVAAVMSLAARGVQRIFLDSDVGIKTPTAMRIARLVRPRLRFSLYEEGTGLIEMPPEDAPGPFSQALGAITAFGESPLTEEVWTYHPAAVRRRLPDMKTLGIDQSLADFVRTNRDLLVKVFWPSFVGDVDRWSGPRSCVYLSSWQVHPRAQQYMERSDAFTVWKLHPHIQGDVTLPAHVDQVIPAGVPAELLIMEMARTFDSVEVLHHGSSTEMYLRLPNVRFHRVDEAVGT